MKKCCTCKEIKNKEDFTKGRLNKDGLSKACRDCCKKRYFRTVDKYSKNRKQWREKNKEKLKIQHKKYGIAHKKEKAIYDASYRRKNKDKLNKQKRDWSTMMKQKFPSFRILLNLRRRINHAIKDNVKSDHTKNLLGCDLDFFLKYLESKFLPGMTWENYGFYGWHIDHIRPCSSFNLSKIEEQEKCFHYSNLQPLWAKDNLEKGSRYGCF